MQASFLATIFALLAAMAWGSGDFSGGISARRIGSFFTVFISYSIGLLALVLVALARRESIPPSADLIWGALAGLAGMAGLASLFRGFAVGRMGIVAPVSAILAAAIPVVFAALTEGLPAELQLLGFGLALLSIWLLSRPEKLAGRPAGLGLAVLAGLGFGAFFTALGQVGESAVFWPLVAGRLAACALLAVIAIFRRRPVNPRTFPWRLLLLAGTLDVAGNLFFLLSVQSGRLDIAAVLGSLYPAVTAILAWVIAREHMARPQVMGLAAAVLSIILISV